MKQTTLEQSAITLSVFQFMEKFPDEESARTYLENLRWNKSVCCPCCGAENKATIAKSRPGFRRCRDCRQYFTVRTGTLFERSHISLRKWLYAIYLLQTSRKGITSVQLSKELGITQKSACFLLHRLRDACGLQAVKLRGIVEIDETYISGKDTNKHQRKKLNARRGGVDEKAVIGICESGVRAKAMPITRTDSTKLQGDLL